MYAINLDENKRILRASYEEFADSESLLVAELPDGDITDYRYDGGYIYDPLPKPEPEETPTTEERIAELEEALELLLSGVME